MRRKARYVESLDLPPKTPRYRDKLHIPPQDPLPSKWPYFHVIIHEDTIVRVKQMAAHKGMRIGKLVDLLLNFALDRVD